MSSNKGLLHNTWHLGMKEFHSLLGDWTMLFLIVFMFTISVYANARAKPESLHRASIAVADEDRSQLSARIIDALRPPQFITPQHVELADIDKSMDAGLHTFVLNIPPNFQRDVLAGRSPAVQLNVDATRQSQAQTGTGYIQNIVNDEIRAFMQRYRAAPAQPVNLVTRAMFNPNLNQSWFAAVTAIINNITMLGILLTGAALIREREHGTIEHLLVMPVNPTEIMLSKVWSMGLVVLVASALSLGLVVRGILDVPVEGSVPLFFAGAALHLFATTSMGIFMATIARNMPQFGMLMVLTILPLQMLSGGATPRESMPELVQNIMLVAPTTHFVELGGAILFRGAGIEVVWKQFLWLVVIGAALFAGSLARFRKTIAQMA